MTDLKHFSFDLWLTLIKSNPDFKKERALYFFKNFNSKKKSIEEVENVFRLVDLMCNSINETTGKNIDSEEMYLMVIYQLNEQSSVFENIDLITLYDEMEKLFFYFTPVVYSPDTLECLDYISQKRNSTINVLSNTAFIKGKSLKKLLEYLDVSKFLSFQIYSDEVHLSKPNIEIFKLLIENARAFHTNSFLKLNEIIHVGDNPISDIAGANAIGINSFQINSNDRRIANLLSL